MKYAVFSVACMSLLINHSVFSQKNNAAVFERYVQNGLLQWKTPGLSVVVVKDGKEVYKNGFGVTELGKQDPFTTSTLSICASTTKAMTAVCMGMLIDEGKIKWTDKVSDIYPELKLQDSYASAELTVKDLFTHNAGLGNADWFWILGYDLDTIICKMRLLKPAYSFRSSFTYQNLMYMVAGEVIHKVSGKSWDDFIRERLFGPLGMQHTYPSYQLSSSEPSHISPHFMYEDSTVKPIVYIDAKGIDAAGGVWSSADDISRWVRFMLDSASVNGKRLLKAETYNELFKPQVMVTDGEFYPTQKMTKPHWKTYGLGWFQEDYRGKMLDFHTGSLDGAVAIIGLIPDEHFGVYIFGNRDHSELRHALMYKAIDLWCFNDNSHDWSNDFFALYKKIKDDQKKKESEKESKHVLNTIPSLEMSAYEGKYSNEIFGNAEIAFRNDTLMLKFPNNITLNLTHWHFDTFVGKYNYPWFAKSWVQFSLNNLGRVSQFEMDGMAYKKME
ncbi:MAG TPA: serine hydrolase [Puia sp.]|jgi:CubicO group peptidase (beta-lactamase class C family)|nr:serine hydrolase [Puia sp.]